MSTYRLLVFLVLSGALFGCSIRAINLSGYENTKHYNVSYLLVNKNADDTTKAMIFMERIDDVKLDLIKDPCIYVIREGNHILVFRARDYNSGNGIDTTHALEVTFESGKHYQVIPYRIDEQLSFRISEIDIEKADEVNRREIKSFIRYLFSDG